MSVKLEIPLEIPNIRLISTSRTTQGHLLLSVESTLMMTPCRRCGRELKRQHGLDRAIRLRHLPIFEKPVYIEIRPRRFECRECEGRPTTTQRLDWYEENSPHTKAFDRWLMLMLINATVTDVSRRCAVGYDAVEGALNRGVSSAVDWGRFETLETVGIDEIALKKGHKQYVAVVTCRDSDGELSVLAVLPDRLKVTVVAFFASIPQRLKATIDRVCTDIYDSYINAAREVLPEAEIVIDRFHVAKNYNEGVDQLRKQEQRRLKKELPEADYAELKGVMWAYRQHWWNLKRDQLDQLVMLLDYSPALEKAYFLRHRLTFIFESSTSKAQALQRLDDWKVRVAESGLSCFEAFLTTLANWREEICNYFNDYHSSGFVEGLNNKLKVIKRRCYGLFDPARLFQRIQLDLDGEALFE